jgi:[acyl-carrier-protein] S-malonyltransferase
MQNNYVLLFPGQGSQSVGMGKELYSESNTVKRTFEEASDALGLNMSRLCFEDPEQKLNLTEFTQPAILCLSIAILRTLQENKALNFNLVAGHSLGEYSALVSIGALKFTDALKAVHFRGQAMQRAVPVGVGAMAAYLGNKCDEILPICHEISTNNEVVEVVNFNSLGQLVLSGHKSAVEKACAVISERKLGKAKLLPVSAPFHSSLMKPAADEMAQFLNKVTFHAFEKQIVANIDAKIHNSTSYNKDVLIKQIASPVLWTQTLSEIHNKNNDCTWIEVGPSKVLTGLAAKTIEAAKCLSTHSFEAVKALLD